MSTKTKSKSNRKSKPSTTFIPQEILDATAERFEDMQRRFGRPLTKDVDDLLAQNDRGAVENRLETVGLARKQAKAAARSITEPEDYSREETLGGVSDDFALRIERLLGRNDMVDVRFLLTGAVRTASVGRIRLGGGRATGFLVAPGVVMTNWHVFQTASDAETAQIEFGYREINLHGDLTTPSTYRFNVRRLFFSDMEHDVAVVSLGDRLSGDIDAQDLPFCRLSREFDAAIAGERLNVIQHPAGEPKQVALRDNTLIAIPDDTFVHYRSDTKRGSSGSPVFNDEWELVGLHHSGVPKTDDQGRWLDVDGNIWRRGMPDDRIWWIANEAIQSSALYRLLGQERFRGEAAELVDAILNPPSESPSEATNLIVMGRFAGRRDDRPGDSKPIHAPSTRGVAGRVELTVPVRISVDLGDATVGDQPGGAMARDWSTVEQLLERFDFDTDYSNRNGYAEAFLDVGVPLPELTEQQMGVAAQNREPICGDEPYELRYHNFSVVMNGARRIPFYTAVNIDGEKLIRIARDDDGGVRSWTDEPRIGEHEQTNNNHYKGRKNRLDRGHLVRRLDPGWGDSDEDAARGILDTFHYSNCTPQYDTFNRTDDRHGRANGLWLGLENHVLENAEADDLKVSVFSGPVFRDDDPDFDDNGVQIPCRYWKVIAWCDDDGELQSAAFLLSQKEMLDDDVHIERFAEEAFDFRERDLFQTTVAHIAELTDFDFGPLMFGGAVEESMSELDRPQRLQSLEDIVLD